MVLNQQTLERLGSEEVAAQVEISDQGPVSGYNNKTISTIVRFHKLERLLFLDDALFSLAIQYYSDLELIIVIQNGTAELETKIVELINNQPWLVAPRYKVISHEVSEGVDGRSSLLNAGLANATGRYLAFLDDDDVVYQHGYETLIRQLEAGEGAVAIGGCRVAKTEYKSNHWFVISKDSPFAWGRTQLDLFMENFVPIHSYVIDRSRVQARDLYFDDEFPPFEDYDFLLRLGAKYDFDFAKVDVPVCEYRVRLDGSNDLPYISNAPLEAFGAHREARDLINERKRRLKYSIPISELIELHRTALINKEENNRLQQELVTCQEEKQVLHRTAGVTAARLRGLEQRVTSFEEETQRLHQTVIGLEQEIYVFRQRVDSYQEEIQRLQEEKQRLDQSVIGYEQERERFPNPLARKTYAFWDRHPKLQKHISNLARSSGKFYRRLKSPD